jgi:UDP-N-acetylglucosamine acyltransferase
LRRRGFSNEKIKEIQDIYRVIFIKGYNITQALSYIEAEIPATTERDDIITFISNSKRGIMRGYSRNGKEK